MSDVLELFYVYVDWTTEKIRRPFYVGYGNKVRIRCKRRNKHHTNIKNAFGIQREIVATFDNKKLAEHCEIALIEKHKTFVYAKNYVWGCNYTIGGDGSRGHRQPSPSIACRRASSIANSHPKSDETKALMKIAAQKRAADPNWVQKMREVSLARWKNVAYRQKRIGMKYNKKAAKTNV